MSNKTYDNKDPEYILGRDAEAVIMRLHELQNGARSAVFGITFPELPGWEFQTDSNVPPTVTAHYLDINNKSIASSNPGRDFAVPFVQIWHHGGCQKGTIVRYTGCTCGYCGSPIMLDANECPACGSS